MAQNLFDINGKVTVMTGACGVLAFYHSFLLFVLQLVSLLLFLFLQLVLFPQIE